MLLLVREDLLGPKDLDVSRSQPLKRLADMRGLARVKGSVHTLLELLRTNAELEEEERPLKNVCLNRVFLGNPGTGAILDYYASSMYQCLCQATTCDVCEHA